MMQPRRTPPASSYSRTPPRCGDGDGAVGPPLGVLRNTTPYRSSRSAALCVLSVLNPTPLAGRKLPAANRVGKGSSERCGPREASPGSHQSPKKPFFFLGAARGL